jgi:hypothetical protein
MQGNDLKLVLFIFIYLNLIIHNHKEYKKLERRFSDQKKPRESGVLSEVTVASDLNASQRS